MSLIVPNVAEVDALTKILTPDLHMKLYSNNVTPSGTSVAGDFTEVTGGGYASKALTFAGWTIVAGAPSTASFAKQTWTFTGATGAPSTVYGYYVTRDSDGLLMWAERLPAVPITPIAGTVIEVTPRFTGGSVY